MRGIGPAPPTPTPPSGAQERGLGQRPRSSPAPQEGLQGSQGAEGQGLPEASVQQLSPAQGIVRCAVTTSSVCPCSPPRAPRLWQFAGPQWPWWKVYTELLREAGSSREGGCGPRHPGMARRLMCRPAHHPSCLLSCHQDRSDVVCNACSHIHSHFDPFSEHKSQPSSVPQAWRKAHSPSTLQGWFVPSRRAGPGATAQLSSISSCLNNSPGPLDPDLIPHCRARG